MTLQKSVLVDEEAQMPWLFTPFFNLLSTLTKVLTTLIYIGIFSLTLNALCCVITLHIIRI